MLAKPLLLIWSAIMGLRSIFTFLKGSCSWSARGKSNHHLIPHLIADLKSTSHKTLHQPSHTHYKPNLHLSYKLDTLLNLMALAASSQHVQNLMVLAASSQHLQPLHFIVHYLKLWCKSTLGSVDAHSIVNCYLLQVFTFLTNVTCNCHSWQWAWDAIIRAPGPGKKLHMLYWSEHQLLLICIRFQIAS